MGADDQKGSCGTGKWKCQVRVDVLGMATWMVGQKPEGSLAKVWSLWWS